MASAFLKMHGLGNDFIVLDATPGAKLPNPARWREISDRHTGVGFDQALVIEAPRRAGTAAFYRIFNADGGEVEQCGNGARCIATLLHERGHGTSFTMDSTGGLVGARILDNGLVSINMGVPDFTPGALPFETGTPAFSYTLDLAGEHVEFGAVSMGNPHAVLRVAAVESAPVERVGKALQAHRSFPRQVNVGFMQIVDAGHIKLRVYERGAGETQACGTGACAAVAVGRSQGLLATEVEVQLPGGKLSVNWPGVGQPLWLTGPAQTSFTGLIEL